MSIGKPLWGTECRVVDAEGHLLGPGEDQVGELLFRGPTIMKGYYRNPEATAATLVDGWLRTGDMVRREESFLWMADRRRELILTGGFNVYPSQVEAAIRDMDGVADVAVVGMDAGARGETVVAAVVPAQGAAPGAITLESVRVAAPEETRESVSAAREIVDEAAHSARVVVPQHQLSLAIGKEGQNARLAAKLTGWRIDIVGDGVTTSAPGR